MEELANNQDQVKIRFAIGLLKISRATYYRRSKPPISKPCGTPKTKLVPRALKPEEKETIRSVVYSERFVDFSVSEIFFTLLDEGIYLASIRTIYRVLQEDESSRERRRQKAHPVYKKPELLATGINQVWSWGITLLRGPVKGQYYRLYVLLDIFSRYVVGYTLAHKESGQIAREMIRDSAAREGIPEGTLTIHSDRGPAMISQKVSVLLGKLEIHKSHSRPQVSNDNPYSESQFKTLKYHWEIPDRFGCFEEANEFIKAFIGWYNHEHHHEGINYLTPAMVHHGRGKRFWNPDQKS